ncbi:hypothetical protein AB0K16_57190 [Nonomuraea jabiensis]|uniref:hypothetical protein n=1 Tax=Nonomuraea jabiensis TaxID=882448 RepID=UPI003412C547
MKRALLALATTMAATVLAGTGMAHADSQATPKELITPTLYNVRIVDADGPFNADDILNLHDIVLTPQEITPTHGASWTYGWCDDEVRVVGGIEAGMDSTGKPVGSSWIRLQEGTSGCPVTSLGLAVYGDTDLRIALNGRTANSVKVKDDEGDSSQIDIFIDDQVIS